MLPFFSTPFTSSPSLSRSLSLDLCLSLAMTSHPQQREFSTRNQFTFLNPIQRASDDQNVLDPMECAPQVERTGIKVGYDRADDLKLAAGTRRASFGPFNYGKHDGEEQFIWLPKVEEDDSGIPSPPLWKKMDSRITPSADSSPMHKHDDDKQLYATSRAQEIARYRQEMLDMVRDMPESAYELSLRDMVETPRIAKAVQVTIEKRREEAKNKAGKAKDKSKGTRKLLRNDSMETGLFLKMFVPISLGGRRRTKSSGGSNTCAKVSPKPVLAEAEKGELESMEGEWWDKSQLGGRGSSSSGSSSSKSSSRSTSRSRERRGCYAFFLTKKSRSKEA